MITSFSNWWAVYAGEAVTRSLALFALCGLIRILLQAASASARAFFWRLTFIALAALPLLALVLPPWRVTAPSQQSPLTPVYSATSVQSVPIPATAQGANTARQAVTAKIVDGSGFVEQTQAVDRSQTHHRFITARSVFAMLMGQWRFLIVGIWMIGVLLTLCRLIAALAALRRLERRTAPVTAPLSAMADELAQTTAPGRNVRFRSTRFRVVIAGGQEVSPLTWGAFRPILLLPAGAENWQEGRLRAVLLHELAHIARNDWASQLLAECVCICYWFHPLVWLAARQLRHENELACDDMVLSCGLCSSDYAAHLLDIVRMRKASCPMPSAATSMAQTPLLEARLRALLDDRRSRRAPSPGIMAACVVLMSLLVAPLATARVVAKEARVKIVAIYPAGQAAFINPIPGFAQPGLPDLSLPAIGRRSASIAGRLGPRAHWPEFALEEGAQAHPRQVEPKLPIAWGKASGDLQVGLERTDGSGVVIEGQHVTFRIWLRNRGKSPLSVTYPAFPYPTQGRYLVSLGWDAAVANDRDISLMPEFHVSRLASKAEDSKNGEATPKTPEGNFNVTLRPGKDQFVSGPEMKPVVRIENASLTLSPGEERILPGPGLRFLIIPIGNSAVTEPTIFLTPGKKTISVAPYLSSGGPSQQRSHPQPVTGALPLEVVTTGNTAVAPPGAGGAKPPVVWGRAIQYHIYRAQGR